MRDAMNHWVLRQLFPGEHSPPFYLFYFVVFTSSFCSIAILYVIGALVCVPLYFTCAAFYPWYPMAFVWVVSLPLRVVVLLSRSHTGTLSQAMYRVSLGLCYSLVVLRDWSIPPWSLCTHVVYSQSNRVKAPTATTFGELLVSQEPSSWTSVLRISR